MLNIWTIRILFPYDELDLSFLQHFHFHSNPDLNEYMLDRYLLNPYFLPRSIVRVKIRIRTKVFQIVLGSEVDPFFTFLTAFSKCRIFKNSVLWIGSLLACCPLLFSQCFSTRPACLLVFLSFWKYLFFLEIAPPSSPRHDKKKKRRSLCDLLD